MPFGRSVGACVDSFLFCWYVYRKILTFALNYNSLGLIENMTLDRRFVYSISLALVALFCTPLSMEGQIVRKILTTQKNKVLRDGSHYKGDMMLMRPHGRGECKYSHNYGDCGYFKNNHYIHISNKRYKYAYRT